MLMVIAFIHTLTHFILTCRYVAVSKLNIVFSIRLSVDWIISHYFFWRLTPTLLMHPRHLISPFSSLHLWMNESERARETGGEGKFKFRSTRNSPSFAAASINKLHSLSTHPHNHCLMDWDGEGGRMLLSNRGLTWQVVWAGDAWHGMWS